MSPMSPMSQWPAAGEYGPPVRPWEMWRLVSAWRGPAWRLVTMGTGAAPRLPATRP